MSTAFESAYDGLRTAIATLFPTATELANAYVTELNSERRLRYGWGLTVGSAQVGRPAEFNTTAEQTQVDVVLTREVVSTEEDPEPLHTAVKGLKADAKALRAYLEGGTHISALVDNVGYLSSSDVTLGASERSKWIRMVVSFSVWTTEPLT